MDERADGSIIAERFLGKAAKRAAERFQQLRFGEPLRGFAINEHVERSGWNVCAAGGAGYAAFLLREPRGDRAMSPSLSMKYRKRLSRSTAPWTSTLDSPSPDFAFWQTLPLPSMK